MKRRLTNITIKTMPELKLKIDQIVNELIHPEFIKSLTGFSYFFV